ncbi:MAG: hypothetical protein ACI87V_002144, partial [Flavobacteriales bacterium]
DLLTQPIPKTFVKQHIIPSHRGTSSAGRVLYIDFGLLMYSVTKGVASVAPTLF